jgi:HAD superfamily hydrolase (TIGR01490 family)
MAKRYLALFDIDKTIYNGFTLFPLAEFQLKYGLINQSCLAELYEDLKLFKDSKVIYEETVANLCTHWADGLKGKMYTKILHNSQDFFKTNDKFYTYFPKVLSHFSKTHDVYLVTGEPQFIAKSIVDKYKVNGYVSAEFELVHGVFTGKVEKFLAKKCEKMRAIQQLLAQYEKDGSFAFGDSEGDIEMLEAVKYQICVNASSGLQKVAIEKGWNIKKPEEVEDFVMMLLNNSK